jgi:glucosamine--fructose-6-phosphate aminotransferase (isomerizing)
MITLSQSGETADTLAALRLSKELGYLGSLAICNVPGSSLVRESDLALMTKAGTEIGVASTKAFTTQLTVLLMLVAKLARLKGEDASVEHDIVHGLQALPSAVLSRCCLRTNALKRWLKISLTNITPCSWVVAISIRLRWKAR